MAEQSVLGYVDRPSPIHRLSGVAKLVLVIGMIVGAMIGFDTRYLVIMLVLNAVLWGASRIRLRDLALVLAIIGVTMLLNNVFIFLFAPGYGEELYGSRTLLVDGPWHWDVTAEQLFYQLNVTLKYFAVLPGVLLFITTTRPPEFASSLHRIGVPYRVAYGVSIALRYIPDVQRDFAAIRLAHQARGLDMSNKAGMGTRIRNLLGAVTPLILGSLERIEAVSSAMELRGFGRGRGRTWYGSQPLKGVDWAVIVLAAVVVAVPILLLLVNGGRFWNPFV